MSNVRLIALAVAVVLAILLGFKLLGKNAAPLSEFRGKAELREPLSSSLSSSSSSSSFTASSQHAVPAPLSASRDAPALFVSKQRSLVGKCLTYEQRYAECLNIHSLPQQQREEFFNNLHRGWYTNPSAPFPVREVILLRMHKKKWPLDFWLSVCAMVVEGAAEGKRHVFLYTLDGQEDSVPAEFHTFIRIHPETELKRIFYYLPYDLKNVSGGYVHGDIACSLFLKQNPQYDFAWLFEADVRYIGSWDQFFSDSRSAAKSAKDYVPASPNNGEGARGVDAHLIFWYPRMLTYGYDFKPQDDHQYYHRNWEKNLHNQWVRESMQAPLPLDPARDIHTVHGWARRRYFYRRWQRLLDNTTWASAFVPAMGVSRRLAMIVYEIYLAGDGNMNQEATLPIAAQLHALKIVSLAGFKKFPSQFFFGFKEKNLTAPLYAAWMHGESATRKDTLRYGLWTTQFAGRTCCEGALFHPVKY